MAASYEHKPASAIRSAPEPGALDAPQAVALPQAPAALDAPQASALPQAPAALDAPQAVALPHSPAALGAPQAVDQPHSPAALGASQAVDQPHSPAALGASQAVALPQAPAALGAPQASPTLQEPADPQATLAAAPHALPAREPAVAYIALGSNMGDREAHLMRAIAELDAEPGIRVTGVSGIYETDPVGYTDQPAFLNMAVAVRTVLEPLELLRTQLRLESLLGRIRQVRWGPRTIDLDLLLYDNVRMDQEELTLPHPRMMERAFVLVPLHDVISSSHPLHEQVATTSARALQAGKDGITLWKTINWRSASEPSGS